MGLSRLFSEDSDFSGLFEQSESNQQQSTLKVTRPGRRASFVEFFTGADKNLSIFPAKCVCRVVHKAIIEINEEGAEAPAPKGSFIVISAL
jgi:Serpin (serine protease inhibitor)